MDALTALKAVPRTLANMIAAKDRLDDYRARITALQASQMAPDRVQHYTAPDQIGDKIARLDGLERALQNAAAEYAAAGTAALRLIDSLDDHEGQIVLIARYVQGMQFKAIAGELEVSERKVYKLHKRAIQSLQTQKGVSQK